MTATDISIAGNVQKVDTRDVCVALSSASFLKPLWFAP